MLTTMQKNNASTFCCCVLMVKYVPKIHMDSIRTTWNGRENITDEKGPERVQGIVKPIRLLCGPMANSNECPPSVSM